MLGAIAVQANTKLVVISGRDRDTLEDWLGGLPIDMSAEHGHFIKENGVWQTDREVDMSWRDDVEAAMQQLVAEYPGSHIETKQASLVWHYRQVEIPVDEQLAEQHVTRAAAGRATVMAGKCVIDVRARGADKGDAVRYWHEQQAWEFVLCIGDDVTDEAMFAALPASAWTINVGTDETNARHQFEHQADVVALLKNLVLSESRSVS